MASSELQRTLQSVVKSLQWTYSLLWQLCPHQGVLVWGEGHYNGAIKTRKTVQPAPPAPEEAVGVEEAALHRSRQLRELYDSLSRETAAAGGGREGLVQAARWPCAALAPEDLTESEWFYLMCASYSFPPGAGLPGNAFARRGHVWLTGANEADSKVFSRAILAKSAGIQTVVCIPILDSVLELGTTEKVEENIGLIHHARSIFMDQHHIHMMPALSEQSTSNPRTHIEQQSLQMQRHIDIGQVHEDPDEFNQEDDNNERRGDDEIDAEAASVSETNAIMYNAGNSGQKVNLNTVRNEQQVTADAGTSELMQIEMSERTRFGSSDDCSNNFDDELQMLMVCQNNDGQSNLQVQDEHYQDWHFLPENLCGGYPQSSAEDQNMSPENAHYSETVSAVIQYNLHQQTESNIKTYLVVSHQSSFSRWNSTGTNLSDMLSQGTPQRMLKSILLSVHTPSHHCNYKEGQSPESRDREGATGFRKGAAQEDLSANHVLKERRRREKLNEGFVILRSLVPFVTKMDKASILGDTIEYVKQLRKRIRDLESQTKQIEGDLRVQNTCSFTRTSTEKQRAPLFDKRKMRALEGSSSTRNPARAAVSTSTDVQVSIIENDALLELKCPYKEGLLLRIMQTLQELQLEVTSVQSSSVNSVLLAELRAKVKEAPGRRASITEVKTAIHLILPLD